MTSICVVLEGNYCFHKASAKEIKVVKEPNTTMSKKLTHASELILEGINFNQLNASMKLDELLQK